MRKATFVLASTIIGLAFVAPVASANDWYGDRTEVRNDRRELDKDTQQMHEAWRNGDRKGVENEMREIDKDRAEIARDRADLHADPGEHHWRKHHRHHHHDYD